jgi:hypothetical protein
MLAAATLEATMLAAAVPAPPSCFVEAMEELSQYAHQAYRGRTGQIDRMHPRPRFRYRSPSRCRKLQPVIYPKNKSGTDNFCTDGAIV